MYALSEKEPYTAEHRKSVYKHITLKFFNYSIVTRI